MNSKIVLPLSIALNVVCIGALLWRNRAMETPAVEFPQDASPQIVSTTDVAEPVAPPSVPAFHWSQIESTNYFAYVTGLRSIGCPEQTIRDIISADVRAALPVAQPASSIPMAQAGRSSWQRREEQLVNHILAAGTSHTTSDAGVANTSHPSALAGVSPGQLPAVRQPILAGMPVARGGTTRSPNEPVPPLKQAPSVDRNIDSPQTGDGVESDPIPSTELTDTNEPAWRTKTWGNKSFWLADLIRARYGIEALLGWQQQAVREGISFDEFVQRHQVPVPALRLQQ